MVHYFLRHGGKHFGPGSSRQRHHDRGGPSSDTASREPENSGQTTRDQSEDRGQMEKAQLCRGSVDWPETACLNGGIMAASQSIARIGDGVLTALRSAATTARRCASPLRWTAVTARRPPGSQPLAASTAPISSTS